jgi:hypothetical protein
MLQSSGTTPVSNDFWNISCSSDEISVASSLRILGVSPVYKKGQKSLAENYRPISLTSVCCKIMEHILDSKIVKHGEENNILYPLQH